MIWRRSTLLVMFCATLVAQEASATREAQTNLAALVQRHCVECHGPDEPDAGLDFAAALKAPRSDALHGRMWRVLADKSMPPKQADALPDNERAALLNALGTLLQGAESRQPLSPRRLSREEVRRSVRDIFGVDLPAEMLPEDELSFGFDNVANVRAIGGAVAEQMLSAAEACAALVLPEGIGGPIPERRIEAEEMRCNTECGNATPFVSLYMNSTLTSTVTLKQPGNYEISVRAAGKQAGDEAARMVVRVAGKRVATHEVAAVARAPLEYTCTLELGAGSHEVVIAFTNDFYTAAAGTRPAADRNLLVDAFVLRGPMNAAPHAPAVALLAVDIGVNAKPEVRARAVLHPVLRLLWRGATDEDALSRLGQLVKERVLAGERFEDGLRSALIAAIASPRFWLRRESALSSTKEPQRSAALAARLALFVWNSAPDATLLDDAERGALRTSEGLRSVATRMLQDPRAGALSQCFAPQWLELRNLAASTPDAQLFASFTPQLRASMASEVVCFFEMVRAENMPARELLRARWSCIDASLAAHYGVPAPENAFARTELPERGGLLGMAAMLTVTSNPGRTSPVKRGRWILDHLLDSPPAPPPANAGALDERPEIAASLPLRERLTQHRRDPSCASCHTRMDALGFALEHFDGIGAWRTADGPHAIDSAGVLPDGRRVDGLATLKQVLVADRAFLRGLLRALLTTAIGRQFGSADELFLQRTLDALPADPSIADLVLAVVGSPVFSASSRD
ncbi:MAG: DUF1592 domain-containing protein [Planctomycetes bacterium]|nr:DUF1592 domain-containing protein [Planctomycetota bacterium]